MKKINKIFMLVVLLGLTLLLASCGKRDYIPIFYVSDINPESLLVDKLDKSEGLADAKFFIIDDRGGIKEQNVLRAKEVSFLFAGEIKLTLEELEAHETLTIDDAYGKEYTYYFVETYKEKKKEKVLEETIILTQLVKDSGFEDSFGLVDFVTLNDKNAVGSNGAVLTNSYLFEGKNVKFYKINSSGVTEVAFGELEFTTPFPSPDKLINKDKKWINHELFDVSAVKDGADFNFRIYLSASDKPLSHKTATFWNWIFLQMPIAFLMSLISSIFGKSFALGIIFTTIIVRTIAWPIYAKTNDMSMKMNIAQPDIDRLNRKYQGRQDPESKQRMQMEMMQIYKKHKINMFGCLLPLLQMPIFLAMFQVVRRITIPGGQFYSSVTNTKFFGTDLAHGGIVAKLIFTALVGITMFLLQKVSQVKPKYVKEQPKNKKTEQANQTESTMKMVSYMMIIMMVFTAYSAPGTALSFYWIIGNIYSIGQTYFNRFMNEKKYAKLQEEKLYGKTREILDAKFKEKGDK